jgi:hypothetical protein
MHAVFGPQVFFLSPPDGTIVVGERKRFIIKRRRHYYRN